VTVSYQDSSSCVVLVSVPLLSKALFRMCFVSASGMFVYMLDMSGKAKVCDGRMGVVFSS
jgi:hypothetical protein